MYPVDKLFNGTAKEKVTECLPKCQPRNLPESEIKGIRFCRQAEGLWVEDFQEGKDPFGEPYYWLAGEFHNYDIGGDNDLAALADGYVSAVPCGHDLTAHNAIDNLNKTFYK